MKYLEVFFTALRLGLTSFGGPIAHLSYFHHEYVIKKKWIDDHSYGDLVALCQFLPGPASSQVGMAIGFTRAGVVGAIFSWLGFTLPSALILILFGLGISHINLVHHQSWLHGLKVVAVSVVAQAIWSMSKKLCPDLKRKLISIASCLFTIYINDPLTQILVLITSALIGLMFLQNNNDIPSDPLPNTSKKTGTVYLILFFTLLFILPLLREIIPYEGLKLVDSFYRAGSLVFGGGHVVLPLLQAEVVTSGWVHKDLFMAGYGLSNAIPGPLFAFSAYLGTVSTLTINGWSGAILSLISAFLPSFLLIMGILPFWEKLKSFTKMKNAMMGVNASVVGILMAAFYQPVWTSAIFSLKDFLLATTGLVLLEKLKLPSWLVVLGAVISSLIIY